MNMCNGFWLRFTFDKDVCVCVCCFCCWLPRFGSVRFGLARLWLELCVHFSVFHYFKFVSESVRRVHFLFSFSPFHVLLFCARSFVHLPYSIFLHVSSLYVRTKYRVNFHLAMANTTVSSDVPKWISCNTQAIHSLMVLQCLYRYHIMMLLFNYKHNSPVQCQRSHSFSLLCVFVPLNMYKEYLGR